MMSGECDNPNPWGEFLKARKIVIFWMSKDKGCTDNQIAENLSMDEKQVYSIRTNPLNFEI